MQFEWNKWLTGLTAFKEDQGLLLLLSFGAIWLWITRFSKKENRLLALVAGLGVLVICPLSAVVLLKGYTPFYDWQDLQLLFPITLLLSYGGTILVTDLAKAEIPGLPMRKILKMLIAWFSIASVLFVGTTFHTFDARSKATDTGVPVEAAEVLDAIKDKVGKYPLVLAAPSEVLVYTRLYDDTWEPLYSRDLWSPKAAAYINSGYDVEYQYYELLEKDYLESKEFSKFQELIMTGPAECVIVPCQWNIEQALPMGWVIIKENDFYTGIIKKDLVAE